MLCIVCKVFEKFSLDQREKFPYIEIPEKRKGMTMLSFYFSSQDIHKID